MLHTLVDDGELNPISRTAFAVTPALRAAYTAGEDDELADVALREAARASMRLLGTEIDDAEDAETADPEGAVVADSSSSRYRRVVIAADVEDVKLRPDLDDAVVRLAAPLALAEVASIHVDLVGAEDAVRAAVAEIDAADLGDTDAEFVLGDAEDHELAWYAPQEIPFLLELL